MAPSRGRGHHRRRRDLDRRQHRGTAGRRSWARFALSLGCRPRRSPHPVRATDEPASPSPARHLERQGLPDERHPPDRRHRTIAIARRWADSFTVGIRFAGPGSGATIGGRRCPPIAPAVATARRTFPPNWPRCNSRPAVPLSGRDARHARTAKRSFVAVVAPEIAAAGTGPGQGGGAGESAAVVAVATSRRAAPLAADGDRVVARQFLALARAPVTPVDARAAANALAARAVGGTTRATAQPPAGGADAAPLDADLALARVAVLAIGWEQPALAAAELRAVVEILRATVAAAARPARVGAAAVTANHFAAGAATAGAGRVAGSLPGNRRRRSTWRGRSAGRRRRPDPAGRRRPRPRSGRSSTR